MKGNKHIRAHEYLTQLIELSPKSQKQIANEVGYEKSNVLTMMKTGETKIPLNKIKALANALSADPVHFLRVVMMDYMPDTWTMLEEIMDKGLYSKEELEILKVIREASGGVPIKLKKEDKAAIADIVRKAALAELKDMESAVKAAAKARGRAVA